MHTSESAPVREIEGLLDAITVVNVNVHVQHSGVVLEQLQDGQHQVIHITETCTAAAQAIPAVNIIMVQLGGHCNLIRGLFENDCSKDRCT